MRRTVVQKTIWVRRTLAAAAVGALLPATRIKVRASFATRSDERTGPGESVRVDCAGEMRKTKCYSLVLFVLLLTIGVGAAGIGVLSAREAEAQEATYCDDLADLVTGASNTDLTCQGLRLQSQRDDYWKDLVIGANKDAGNRKATMEKCGSYLAALSTVMEFVVRGHPYRHVDTNGSNPYGWKPAEQFTPPYLDYYLSNGPGAPGDEGFRRNWGYWDKGTNLEKCGGMVHLRALSDASEPDELRWDGNSYLIGHRGMDLNHYPGLNANVIDENLKKKLPTILIVKQPVRLLETIVGNPDSTAAQIIVGKNPDGEYRVLDPIQDSWARPFVPGDDAHIPNVQHRDPRGYDSYDQWKQRVTATISVKATTIHSYTPRRIVLRDDPSPFEFSTISPDGRRTGYDAATQTQIKEDPSVSSYELGNWADPTGELPPGDPIKAVEVADPVDGTYRFQVTGTGDGPAKFSLLTMHGRQETLLEEVDKPITDGQLLKYELEYSITGESTVSEVSNFTPEARPEVAPNPVAGETLTFDGGDSFDADGSVASYEWDFGDDATGSGSEASHAYEKPGTYTVTLKVTDNQGATDTSTAEVEVAPSETDAPTTTATLSPEPNAEGWNKDDVTVTLNATDGEGGSGVESITYSAYGATAIPETTVEGTSAQLEVTGGGSTEVRYRARDKMGNIEEEKTLEVRLDKTGPRTVVEVPANGAVLSPDSGSIGSLQTLAGTVEDFVSNVASVQVSLRREGDGRYWNGSEWVDGEHWLDAALLDSTATSTWSISTDLPTGDALDLGSYTVRARAADKVGNVAYSSGNTFVVKRPDTAPAPPPDVAGTRLSEDDATLTGNCDESRTSTVNFEASGLVTTGRYVGTFTESGTATLGPMQSNGNQPVRDLTVNFTIVSSAGKVTGTKKLVAGSSSGTGSCVVFWSGRKELSVSARALSYEAVIETPAGCKYVDRGLSNVQAIDSDVFLHNPFSESYTSDSRTPELVPGSTCSADKEAPKLELPPNLTEEATSKDGAEVTFTAEASDQDPSNPEVTCTPASGSTFPLGETTVNCSATDKAGNEAEGSFKVTVNDTTPPETSIDSGPDGPTKDDTPAFAFSGSDKVTADSDLLFSYKVDNGDWSAYSRETSATLGGSTGLSEGSHTFYVRAKDEAGNEDASPAERSFSVEPPNKPPTADAGGPYEVEEGGSVEVNASGSDPEGKDLTYEWDLDDNGSFETPGQSATFSAADLRGPSSHRISVRVTDAAGASATDEAMVTVKDATAPTIGCGTADDDWHKADVNIWCEASDDGSGLADSGDARFSLSTTVEEDTETGNASTGTREVCDAAGNCATAGPITGIKVDKKAPAVSCSVNPKGLWPPNHKLVTVNASVTVRDEGSGPGEFKLTSATSDEPDNGLGDGDTSNDIQGFVVGTADTSGKLRAERSGTGDGRVYTLTYEGADAAGNLANCAVLVTVSHDRGR